ncbi:SIR2 family protein [Sphingomonas cannabina]|uniref:SIR2 family protein n=1 Tax=Sphingomonas cannabina TaxID=2899123 RepID=UPI001F1DF260|nr:SIR2 family protein [Sphingomonas cannabina]UIJ47122.1 SIR2 family protein [Sphingomonas cannabina]
MALAPTATQITVREVIARFEADFAAVARAIENGEFALWVGSGISRRAPDLGILIARAIEYLRVRAVEPATAATYLPALREAVELGGQDPAALEHRFTEPFATWPERGAIIDGAWNNYSRVLDIRVPGQANDFILWNAIDIRDAFANPAPPAAQHLCIAILILEGAVRTVASANWDGFIEAAVERLSNRLAGVLQVVVDPNQMREPPGRAQLLKFHGCIRYATQEPLVFRQYLTGSRTQIMEWPEAGQFAAMCNAVVNIATNQKALVLGLSIQDNNLQSVFSRAKQVNPWPWPCAPQAAAHVFCEDTIKQGQRDVLRIVYGDAYNDNVDDIHASSHLRAWAEQVLIALVLKLLAAKLVGFMTLFLDDAGKNPLAVPLTNSLHALRDAVADLATVDPADESRTRATVEGIALWSRLLSIFRTGALPAAPDAYEALSALPPYLVAGDANAQAMGLGRLAVGLALLQHGITTGHWTLDAPAGPEPGAGALRATATHPGAVERPVFLVKSATDAIALQSQGAFVNDNAIVVHGDDAWHRMVSATGSARRVRSAPGRTGHVGTTHISLGYLVEQCDNVDALQQAFVSELIL